MAVRREETPNSQYSEVQSIPLQRLPRDDTCNEEYAKLVNQDKVPLQAEKGTCTYAALVPIIIACVPAGIEFYCITRAL